MKTNGKHEAQAESANLPEFPSTKPIASILGELEMIEAERANLLRTQQECEAEEQTLLNSEAELNRDQVNQISVARMKLEMIPRRLDRLGAREEELRAKALTAAREASLKLNQVAREFEVAQIERIERAIQPWAPAELGANDQARSIWDRSAVNHSLRCKAYLLFHVPVSIEDGINAARDIERCIDSAREIMSDAR